MFGIAKWKSSELPLPSKIVNQKQYYILGGISDPTEDLKDAG